MPTDSNLHKAAHKGDIDELKKYIEGIELPEDEEKIDVNEPGAADRRPLHRSAGAGHMECCVYLLEQGAIIDCIDKSGRTALHWAAISGHTEIVKLLLSHNADILAVTIDSKINALQGAVEAGRVDTIRALMEHVGDNEEKKNFMCNNKNAEDKCAWDIAAAAKSQAVCSVLKEMGDANGASSSCTLS